MWKKSSPRPEYFQGKLEWLILELPNNEMGVFSRVNHEHDFSLVKTFSSIDIAKDYINTQEKSTSRVVFEQVKKKAKPSPFKYRLRSNSLSLR